MIINSVKLCVIFVKLCVTTLNYTEFHKDLTELHKEKKKSPCFLHHLIKGCTFSFERKFKEDFNNRSAEIFL